MQRAARSIVPTDNREGFVNDGTDNSTVSNADSAAAVNAAPAAASQPAEPVRRRRGGRRVVRGTGAAGASLELQVQERTPLFEAPALPDAGTAADSSDSDESSDSKDSAERPTRRRTRRAASTVVNAYSEDDRPRRSRRTVSVDDFDDDDAPRSRRRSVVDDNDYDEDRPVRRRSRRAVADTHEDTPDERLFDAVESLPFGHETVRRGKPMTSLLFQEPVLPAAVDAHDTADTRDDDVDADERPSRRSRRSRSHDDDDAQPRSRRRDDRDDRGRNAAAGDANASANADHDDFDSNDASDSRRSRRSRRLNAQERRAAAEVEQIEEDLELDDIAYSPIAEEEGDEESDAIRTRSRRRRRRGSRGETGANGEHDTAENDAEDTRSRHRADRDDHDRDRDEDDEEQTVTRRRRRRRGGKNGEGTDDQSQNSEQPLVRRSRKQQYIDEITDVEGSTRLEAKKQRRRDNRRERSRQSQLMEQDFLARRENVDRLMVVREKEQHTQISVVEDNVLVEHYVSDIQEVQTVGNIYLGRVQNVLPSMEAAFVDIGQARNGVLYAGEVNWDAARLEGQPRRIELAFKSGDPVLVQVTKDPIGHKGARLTSQVTLAGRFLVLVPSGGMTGVSRKLSERERSRLKNIVSKIAPKDMGVIIRTAAEGASEDAIVKDLESLVRQWERINAKREEFWHGKRPKLLQGEPDVAIRVVRDIFNDDFSKLIVEGDKVYGRIEEYLDTMAPDLKDKLERWDPAEHEGKDVFDKWSIDSQLRKGMERQVYLPSGGSIVIDRTEAMTTIDVNTGRFIGRGKSLEETVTRCNLEASEEIARQLRLRDIGGMVMIDYVDMVMPANRDLVLRRLVECLARDRTKHQVAEVTSLGLVQMTRKRIGQGLVEAFSEECPTCKGRGFILHDQPTVSADYDDPYALRGGDPFVKTNKHGRGTAPAPEPAGSSADVKAKLAQIAAAAVAANNTAEE
ncbi:Rne/Rng family ribonuclease [Bifidobacterium longum subsp. infantis]|uniref:Ribonuclease E n=1 Tax=Bifidobacterium longum subsp. infantis TaxID=1682 RepID=A0A7D4Y388_BIFLI|nr:MULTISPECIES: Rne/Rng family ribonuclease [Bifidobacterium]KEY30753.1 ribonuclease G [Bifidobacterium longum subsp. infantis EK3]NQX51460.1 Rne/Rng family ribonuclease [Bifidobacterium longum subsp. infantis]QKY14481.1 Rne/Rng family ribonuclease [Bifidobacterium longum subsp. infantis]UPT03644.1 Rne/Rng family ribonuclease [Bifidobacterium longum subsp. infantis]UPT05733.1 Rne/Rng family ribonuclease [Bifidobacterium longum subsp. infantis]